MGAAVPIWSPHAWTASRIRVAYVVFDPNAESLPYQFGLMRFFSPQTRDFNPGSRASAGRGRMWNMGDDIGKEREAE